VLRQTSADSNIQLLKSSNDLIVAGYASVELVDKQGDMITRKALKEAFKKYMEEPKYRNVQLAHSNIQVGEVIPSYTDSEGRLWKSEVDDAGMFVVVNLRTDIEKAREVAAEIRKGSLRGFSIGGQAFKRVRKSDAKHGDYQEISKLELHEITICEKGINPEATFRILKEDKKNNKVKKMTDDVMEQMTDVLSRLEGRLDSMEKGEIPEGLKRHQMDKKKGKKEGEETETTETTDDKMDKGVHAMDDDKKNKDDKKKSDEYSDVITSEYLDWMENTLKGAGVDIDGARNHFDDLAKANLGSSPESIGDGGSYFAGQAPGRVQEGGNPSVNAVGKLNSGKGKKDGAVEKSQFLVPSDVDGSQIENAYEVYKAAKREEEFRATLEKQFEGRYHQEITQEYQQAEAAAFDARGPLGEIQKAISSLSERIDNIGSDESVTLQKSVGVPTSDVVVPSTPDMANMSWEEVHQLAGSVFRGD
tara:strand:+ start:23748 stop:25172 length:1425 start_codon:yes stop_codon:yes gene_type:complete